MSAPEPYSTNIWVSRIQGLQAHLRIIRDDLQDSEFTAGHRAHKQAIAGLDEADRYLADRDWSTDAQGPSL